MNGEGEDAGVVYCEMQARENTGESLTHLELLRAMYPGKCGYKVKSYLIRRNFCAFFFISRSKYKNIIMVEVLRELAYCFFTGAL